MARLHANGGSLGVLDYGYKKVSIQANGTVLQNWGEGWKIRGKIKPQYDPLFVHEERQSKLDNDALLIAYRRALWDACGRLLDRNKLHTLIGLLPDDLDGIWAEMNGKENWGNIVRTTTRQKQLLESREKQEKAQ